MSWTAGWTVGKVGWGGAVDFRSGAVSGGAEVDLIQLYPDPWPFPGFELPVGSAGDELVLFVVSDRLVGDGFISSVIQWESTFTTSTALTIEKEQVLPDADAVFYLIHGDRIADLARVDIIFPTGGPYAVEWIVAGMPAGTYVDKGDQTYSSDTGTFTPTGGPTLSLSMDNPTNLLQYAHAIGDGTRFAGAVVAYFEAGSPHVSGATATEQIDGDIYSWVAFTA